MTTETSHNPALLEALQLCVEVIEIYEAFDMSTVQQSERVSGAIKRREQKALQKAKEAIKKATL